MRRDAHAEAARFDLEYRTRVFTWLVDHEPSRLDVSGVPVKLVAPFDPGARIRAVSTDVRAACRAAREDRALLLAFARIEERDRRARALDCGFALVHDGGALVLAPR